MHTKRKDSVLYNCDICNKQYTHKENLAAHVAIIHKKKEKPYGCDKCEKRFFKKGQLDTHLTTHGTSKNVKCTTCDKSFFSSYHLGLHTRKMHLRPKPVKKFTCKLCMKDFRSGQTLKSHTNFVHEGKGEKCDICFVELSDTIAIRRHKKAIHERQIMYECDSCGKTFNEEGNLRRHVKTVHEKMQKNVVVKHAERIIPIKGI